jgi:hypothetical protein
VGLLIDASRYPGGSVTHQVSAIRNREQDQPDSNVLELNPVDKLLQLALASVRR